MSCDAEMVGYAIFDDFILFSISGPTYSRQLWAYDVSRNKWYLVNVDNVDCYGLRGLAVVLEKTVYALSSTLSRSVLALSITREQIDGRDPVFTCSLQSVFTLPYTELLPLDGDRGRDHLVHLGNHEFCLVQSGVCYGYVDYQPIRLSIFQLLGKNSVNITYTIDYEVPLQDFEPFHVRLCFSLPGCEDIVSEREDNSDINFIFDPAFEVVKPAPEEGIATLSEEEEETIVDTSSFKNSALLNIKPNYPPPCDFELSRKLIAVQRRLDVSTHALFVANNFVKYYYLVRFIPGVESVYKFYRDSSASCCINGNMTTVDAFKSDELHTLSWVIESVDAQESSQKEVTVLVTRYLVGNDNLRRKFAQTFFQTSKEDGYFILHDMFRFIEDNESLQTNITDEQGHSIHVSNLPYDATFEQLEKEFKKCGSIKGDGIQIRRNDKRGYSFGFVEFGSVTSMQNAIEASTITIGDCKAVIEKKRTPLSWQWEKRVVAVALVRLNSGTMVSFLDPSLPADTMESVISAQGAPNNRTYVPT